MLRRLALLVLVILATTAFAQTPTPDEFLGYKLGDRFTPWDHILDYFNELAKESNLITVQTFGHTYEGRPLVLAILTSPKNRARLDEIRNDLTSIANGDADAARASSIAKNDPAVAWLAFNIHGNEASSSEAAMEVASTLLRAPAILDALGVITDPLH